VLLFIDNADSFTFNLVQAFRGLGEEVQVRSGSPTTWKGPTALQELSAHPPAALVLGPGPGRPEAAETSLRLLTAFAGHIPILGICLGHQALALHLGARVDRSARLTHGQTSRIHHRQGGLFSGLPSPLCMTRYNSLCVIEETLPPELEVSARDDSGEVMALAHKSLPLWGLQFHPEAIRSVGGVKLLQSFLGRAAKTETDTPAGNIRVG